MKATCKADANFTFHLVITESEMRALDGLVGYGFEAFRKAFYEHLGKAYMEPNEAGLKSLFNRIDELRPHLSAIDEVKKQVATVTTKYNL